MMSNTSQTTNDFENKWSKIFAAELFLREIGPKTEAFKLLQDRLYNLHNELVAGSLLQDLDKEGDYINFRNNSEGYKWVNNLLVGKHGYEFARRILLFKP